MKKVLFFLGPLTKERMTENPYFSTEMLIPNIRKPGRIPRNQTDTVLSCFSIFSKRFLFSPVLGIDTDHNEKPGAKANAPGNFLFCLTLRKFLKNIFAVFEIAPLNRI